MAVLKPHTVKSPQGARPDPYYWLRDDTRSDAEVLAHLQAENDYKAAVMAPYAALEAQLYEELVGRTPQNDQSAPKYERGYWYYRRYEAGREYAIHARRKGRLTATEEILLDGNLLAADCGYFSIGSIEVSPDGGCLAYTVDTVGRRQYTLEFKDLRSGETLRDTVGNITPSLAWANDNRTVLYVERDPVTLLTTRIRAHVLGSTTSDRLIYDEPDDSFYLGVSRSKSGDYLFIDAESTLVSEWRFAAAGDLSLQFTPVLPREPGHEYQVEHLGDRFIIRSNWGAPNFRLLAVPVAHSADKARWQDLMPHRDDAFIESFDVFNDGLAVNERSGGLLKIRVRGWHDEGFGTLIEADEPSYSMHLHHAPDPGGPMRYVYSSLSTPDTTYDVDLSSLRRTRVRRLPVPGAFDPADYQTAFLFIAARDGARIPVSLVHRRDTPVDGSAPLYQYAYGAYGYSIDPSFRVDILSLLDRGFVFALAHVRGGQELGRQWYEEGRLLNKMNTFSDFIDVTTALVDLGYAAPDRVFAMGGSAGGLLMGAIANMAPQKYRGIVAHVPFVDVVTTMLDESIPLTTNEFEEWGNPKSRPHYDYMLSYSPYDNVTAQEYPAMLVTTGLWDSQVQYYEPAKWVAKLRALKTDSNPLLFRVNMDAGHGGQSGRFQSLHETAEEYSFILAELESGLTP